MYCINCGKELDDDAVFCDECGCPVEQSDETAVLAGSKADGENDTMILDDDSAGEENETAILDENTEDEEVRSNDSEDDAEEPEEQETSAAKASDKYRVPFLCGCLCLLAFALGVGVGIGIGRRSAAVVTGSDLVSADTIAITVLSQPESAVAYVEDVVTFSVEAVGSDLHYQWYYKKAGETDWSEWDKSTKPKATTKVYASWNAAEFYCKITDGKGHSVNSQTASLTVSPKITVQPVDAMGSVGKKASFTVKASGAGLTYQWYYKKKDGITWTRWSKQTKSTATLDVYQSWDGTQFYCEIKDVNGEQIKTDTVKLIVG